MTELQKVSRKNIIEALELFSSKEEQLDFQLRVPYVDVSTDLFWDWESDYIIDQEWFRAAHSVVELQAMANFNQTLEEIYVDVEKIPPIREFVLTAEWKRLSEAATSALNIFEVALELKTT